MSLSSWSFWRGLRRLSQLLCLAAFFGLLLAPTRSGSPWPLADLFFRLDPLAALAGTLASRSWQARLGLALVTLLLTLLVGRAWCGWICPLGTLLEWTRFASVRARANRMPPRWRRLKFLLLFATLGMALFGSLAMLALDPLALLTRAWGALGLPALNYAVTALEGQLYAFTALRPLVNALEGLLRGGLLPAQQPVYLGNGWLALLFFGLLALNSLTDRFWCRYLCPLGGLLGLLARLSLFRPLVGPACTGCAQCTQACRLGAIDAKNGFAIEPAECSLCLDCLARCPEQGIGLRFYPHPLEPVRAALPAQRAGEIRPRPSQGEAARVNPVLTRRQALQALAAGAASVLLLRIDPATARRHPGRIRPPGVTDEATFLSACLRCAQCLEVCPTHGLQPAIAEAGLEGLWTPRLVPRLGSCEYACHACGQVCPSGAIPRLTLEQKRAAVLGQAVVDRNRCLPWARDTECIVCEEMCPIPEKAVRLEVLEVVSASGEPRRLQRPVVLIEKCIGCGICENHCPLEGQAAIQVVAVQA
jgi:MauM/NapG family ferredoxin protein